MVKTPTYIHKNIPLAPHTTLRVGGSARFFCEVSSVPQLIESIAFARSQNIPWSILGGGSNTIVSDRGYSGLVIKMKNAGRTLTETRSTVSLCVQAGEDFDEIVAYTTKQGWWGLENLSYIPGSVGALPIQNVGAYGVEAAQVILCVDVYDVSTGILRTLSSQECGFGYRDSIFKHQFGKDLVVIAVTFTLSKIPNPILNYGDLQKITKSGCTPQIIREAVIAIRREKFPDWNVEGTAGSFFKNPILPSQDVLNLQERYPGLPVYSYSQTHKKISLGYILDIVCQLRGARMGDVGLYEKQALVLVTYPGATASEVDSFVSMVAKKVFDTTGIIIEREVCELQN